MEKSELKKFPVYLRDTREVLVLVTARSEREAIGAVRDRCAYDGEEGDLSLLLNDPDNSYDTDAYAVRYDPFYDDHHNAAIDLSDRLDLQNEKPEL